MTFKRWLPTFLAFPIGGWLAIETVGSLRGPVSGAVGGLIAGAVIGTGQWLALRPAGVGAGWIARTAAAMAGGTALAAAVTGAGTDVADVMLLGAIAGGAVGGAQATLLPRGAAAWTALTAAAWSLGWLTAWGISVDVERAYYVFGASGAILVTLVTGAALRHLAGARSAVAMA